MSVMSVFIYRTNSLLMSISPLVWMLTVITFISVLFSGTKEIGGWHYWETMFLLGIHELIFIGSWFLFIANLQTFNQEIGQGRFDRMLLRPINHRFLVSFNSVDLSLLGGLINALLVTLVALSHLVIKISVFKILIFLFSFLSSYVIVYLVYFCISTLSLFFINAETMSDWLLEATDFDRFPAEIYSNLFRNFLYFVIPILFFAYVPTAILLDKLPYYFAGLGILLLVWLCFLSTLLWKKGLKKYQSASS